MFQEPVLVLAEGRDRRDDWGKVECPWLASPMDEGGEVV